MSELKACPMAKCTADFHDGRNNGMCIGGKCQHYVCAPLTEDVVECENCLTGMTGGTITRGQFGDLVNELRIKSIKFNYCPICGKELSYLW